MKWIVRFHCQQTVFCAAKENNAMIASLDDLLIILSLRSMLLWMPNKYFSSSFFAFLASFIFFSCDFLPIFLYVIYIAREFKRIKWKKTNFFLFLTLAQWALNRVYLHLPPYFLPVISQFLSLAHSSNILNMLQVFIYLLDKPFKCHNG